MYKRNPIIVLYLDRKKKKEITHLDVVRRTHPIVSSFRRCNRLNLYLLTSNRYLFDELIAN